jgi:hypothetical protein
VSKTKPKQVTLEKLPRVGHRHTWADYVELLCLFNLDREVSKDVLVERFRERQDTGEELDEEPEDEVEETIEHALGETQEGAFTDERLGEKAEELFRHLKFREGVFGKKYPFAVDMTRRRLTLRRTTGASRLYLFLLLASNLRYFRKLTQRLTSDFETLSKRALEQILPETAKVYFFHGAGRSGRYKGRLFDKLTLLAEDLAETMNVDAQDFEDGNVGDGGLDLVGWVPLGDSVPGMLLCLAQCACTDKWVKKQREPLAIHEIMTLKGTPAKLTFIPFCFRRPTGEWFYKHDVATVVMDRLRLMYLMREPRQYRGIASLKEIGALIKQTEPLI